jgi:hypothetical protein
VDALDDVRPGEHQVLVAALVLGASEVRGLEVLVLDERAHGAVEHQDALAHRGTQGLNAAAILTRGRRQGGRQVAHAGLTPVRRKTRKGLALSRAWVSRVMD